MNLLYNSTLSWRRPLSQRNQSIDLLCQSMDWFLYDIDLRHEGVKNHSNLREKEPKVHVNSLIRAVFKLEFFICIKSRVQKRIQNPDKYLG